MKVMAQIAMVMNSSISASAATRVPSRVSRRGRTARAPNTCGLTTWRPVPASATRAAGRTRSITKVDGSGRPMASWSLARVAACAASATSSLTPALPELDDYYEPRTYEYDKLLVGPQGFEGSSGGARKVADDRGIHGCPAMGSELG